MSETRKFAPILVADVVGYGRLAGADEDRTVASRGLRSDLIDPAIAAHHGYIIGVPATARSSSSAAWGRRALRHRNAGAQIVQYRRQRS
jgi:hypothetical protein